MSLMRFFDRTLTKLAEMFRPRICAVLAFYARNLPGQWWLPRKEWPVVQRFYGFIPVGLDCILNKNLVTTWWHHQMETFSALLTICAGNSSVTGEFPSQRPVTRSFDVFFDLRLNKRSSKQSWGWWFETPSCSLWGNYDVMKYELNGTTCSHHNVASETEYHDLSRPQLGLPL